MAKKKTSNHTWAFISQVAPITSTEVQDQIKALVRAWDTPWAADQLFTRNAMSSVIKFHEIAQQRKSDNDKAYLRWMIGWTTIAGAKNMASSYENNFSFGSITSNP